MTEDQLDKLRADATAAAAKVKQMKKDGASKVCAAGTLRARVARDAPQQAHAVPPRLLTLGFHRPHCVWHTRRTSCLS